MADLAELTDEIARDKSLPEAERLEIVALLRRVLANEAKAAALPPLTPENLALLDRAAGYLALAQRLTGKKKRQWTAAILLALCDLYNPTDRK